MKLTDLSTKNKALYGALIGIARATDGNEHLITARSTAFLLKALAHPEQATLAEAREEKRNMVPNCFACASPCGRTADYDLDRLEALDPEIRQKKLALLEGLRALAPIPGAERHSQLFYHGLIAVGMEDLPEKTLLALLQELDTVTKSLTGA